MKNRVTCAFLLIFNLVLCQVDQVIVPDDGCPIYTITTNPSSYNNSIDPDEEQKWDWLVDNYTVYITQNGEGTVGYPVFIKSPFYDISNNPNTYDFALQSRKDNKPEDGWELMFRNFGNVEQGTQSPLFILYNRYTGVIRVFYNVINSGEFPYNAAKIQLTFKDNSLLQTALLNQLGSHSFSFMDFQSEASHFVPNQYTNSGINDNYFWVWADFNTMFDPCTCGVPSNMRLDIGLINSIDITMSGFLTQKTIVDAVSENESNVNDDFWSKVQRYIQFGSGVIDGIGTVAASGTRAFNDGNRMLADVQQNVQNLAPLLGRQTANNVSNSLRRFFFEFPRVNQVLNIANTAITVVKKINGQFDDLNASPSSLKSPSITEVKTSVNISGNLDVTGNRLYQRLILPGSLTSNDDIINEYKPIYNNVLGVLTLSEQPEFDLVKYQSGFSYVLGYNEVTHELESYTFPDIRHLKLKNKPKLILNPASNLKIKSVEYKIVFENKEVFSDVFADNPNPALVGPMIPGKFSYFSSFGVDQYKFKKSKKDREDLMSSFGYALDLLNPQNNNSSNWDGARFSTPYLNLECFIKTGVFSFSEIKKPELKLKVIMEPVVQDPNSEVHEVIFIYTFPATVNELYSELVYTGSQTNNNEVFIDLPIDETEFIYGFYDDLYLENTTITENVKVLGDLTIGENVSLKPGSYSIYVSKNINFNNSIDFVPFSIEEIYENNGQDIDDYNIEFVAGNEIYNLPEVVIQPEVVLRIDPLNKLTCESMADEQVTGDEIAEKCNSEKYKSLISKTKQEGTIVTGAMNSKSKEGFDFILSPNPTESIVRLALRNNRLDNMTYVITDPAGKKVQIPFNGSALNEVELDFSAVEKGIYFVTVSSGFEQITKQIIVQ